MRSTITKRDQKLLAKIQFRLDEVAPEVGHVRKTALVKAAEWSLSRPGPTEAHAQVTKGMILAAEILGILNHGETQVRLSEAQAAIWWEQDLIQERDRARRRP